MLTPIWGYVCPSRCAVRTGGDRCDPVVRRCPCRVGLFHAQQGIYPMGWFTGWAWGDPAILVLQRHLPGLSFPARRCNGDGQVPRRCRRAQPSGREPWCCRMPAWPPQEPTAATARTVASCMPCHCSWGVSSMSAGWGTGRYAAPLAWASSALTPGRGLPRRDFTVTQGSLRAGWAAGQGTRG